MAKRLFIALELPDTCRKTLSALNPNLKGLRWLPEHQLHVTLSFVGEVNPTKEELLRAALGKVRIPEFFLPIQGIGTFGGAWPTVVWAGLGKAHPHLFALHRRVQDAALRAGLDPDLKPFHPHITLARATNLSSAALLPFLRRHSEVELGLWKVTGFAMFSSLLSRDGPRYTLELRQEFRD